MGKETQFTPEELKILGEEPPTPTGEPEKTPSDDGAKLASEGGEKPEPKEEPKPEEVPTDEEKQAAEAQGLKVVTEKGKTYIVDDDGTKIPPKRWKGLYHDYQERGRQIEERDRKFNLFKELGPEKYYEIYKDEVPQGWKPPEKPDPKADDLKTGSPELGSMVVQGGPHNGKTLNEVWQEDPAYAAMLQANYLNAERQKEETARQTQERVRKESEDEVNAFTVQLSKELFGKEVEKLSKDEEGKITSSIQSVLDWMAKTGRGGGRLEDAYFIMNREKHISDAKARGGKEALESLKRPSVPSIGSAGGSTVTGYGAYEEKTAEELNAILDKMSEKDFLKFLKEAPASLRAKFPSVAWT